MDWRNVLLILFGSSFGIGQGIFSCILEILFDIGDYFLLAGGFALTILLGILSKNKYLPFASVLSAFVTFQVMVYHYLGGDYGIEPSWLLPLLAVIYGVPWVLLRSATSGKKRKKFVCPRCKNEIEENWVSCPYCGMKIKDDTRVYDTPDNTQLYDIS